MMMATQVAGDKRRTFDGFHITGTGEGCNNSSAVASASRGKRPKTSTKGIYNPTKEKDKISERIATLQQLVCPFGKTDTASILEEATGYIKFLHDQLQVLSAPYLQTPIMQNKLVSSQPHTFLYAHGHLQEAENNSLTSRGLCLMPVSSTSWIARSNGADMWAPMNMSKHL